MNNVIADNKNIGNNFKIAGSAHISCKELVIGNDVVIDERVKIICKHGKVVIGDQVLIGNDVTIILKSFEIGDYTKLHNHSLLNGKASVKIGENCWIGQNCILNGETDLIIGNNVGIGTYSSVWTHGYFGQLVDGCSMYSIKPTIVEDDVWLVGSYNTIFPGVTIGKKAVLMGTSVVIKSLEAGKIYSGNPAKEITDKVGQPYKPIAAAQKLLIIRENIELYLREAGMGFSVSANLISINEYGDVYFDISDEQVKQLTTTAVGFFSEVTDWTDIPLLTKCCMTNKVYQKKYTTIEILVKKILNPVVARFTKFNN